MNPLLFHLTLQALNVSFNSLYTYELLHPIPLKQKFTKWHDSTILIKHVFHD